MAEQLRLKESSPTYNASINFLNETLLNKIVLAKTDPRITGSLMNFLLSPGKYWSNPGKGVQPRPGNYNVNPYKITPLILKQGMSTAGGPGKNPGGNNNPKWDNDPNPVCPNLNKGQEKNTIQHGESAKYAKKGKK